MSLGLKGPIIGETLNDILSRIMSGELHNNKEDLLNFVKNHVGID